MTNHAERAEPWLAAVAQMDNKLLSELLAKRIWGQTDPAKAVQWLSCFRWVTSKDVAPPSELVFPLALQDTDTHLACLYSSSKARKILKIEIKIRIEDCLGVTAAGLKALERCSGIKSFLLWTLNAPAVVKELAQTQWQCFKTLECIDLSVCYVDPDCISAISSQCPGLKELTISFNRAKVNISDATADETVKRLCVEMPGLEVLCLIGAFNLSLTGFAHLKSLTNLRSLETNACRHTDALLAVLATMPSVRKLNLSNSSGLTAAGFEHFKGGLVKLTHLALEECEDVTDENLACLSGMKHLQNLHIMSHGVSDQGLAHLQGLTSLQDLYISSNHITGAGLAHLSQVPLLKLSLSVAQMTDAWLDSLHCFSQLEELELWGHNITTKEGVERVLAACKKIEKVSCDGELISEKYCDSLEARGF